jgi:pyrroloquinoline quinone biosynthesis protein D
MVEMPLTSAAVPVLWRLARLDFDAVRQRHVLLYPEGTVLLNETSAAILGLCDGHRTVAEITLALQERYAGVVAADVSEFLSQLAERELIRDA